MKYMLLIYSAESGWNEPEREACMLTSLGVCEELAAQGKFIAASPLHSVMTATSVRVRDGKPLITDGPFAETTEQLGGYYVIDVDNLDEASEWVARAVLSVTTVPGDMLNPDDPKALVRYLKRYLMPALRQG